MSAFLPSGTGPSVKGRDEFQSRYRGELQEKHKSIKLLRKKMSEGTLTLVHAAHHPERSGAKVLKQFLEEETGISPEQA